MAALLGSPAGCPCLKSSNVRDFGISADRFSASFRSAAVPPESDESYEMFAFRWSERETDVGREMGKESGGSRVDRAWRKSAG